ncbi:MAG: 3',5'-cyclic-AMP phosphodiesterase [Proteobacteria bacterium]|nr:3',5'-cyclic-AMP phosphodiesterase [Pseudomonadota bacterium]
MNRTAQPTKPIRIIQITDFHLLADPRQTMMGINTEQSFLAVLEHAWRNHGGNALFLLTGDLVQDPSIATYKRLRDRLEMLSAPCYCLPGNHDDPELIRQHLAEGNIHYHSQILLDGWQIVCLDSTIPGDPGGYLTPNQLSVLETKLAGQPGRHALVCLHHSPLATGSDWLDTMKLSNAKEFFAIIDRFPRVKGIVYGHIHQAMDVQYKGLRLLSCPSTCFQFKPNSKDFALDQMPQGYRWLELHPNGEITTEVIRLDFVPKGLDMASNGY